MNFLRPALIVADAVPESQRRAKVSYTVIGFKKPQEKKFENRILGEPILFIAECSTVLLTAAYPEKPAYPQ